MSGNLFDPVYVSRVLGPSYVNWRRLYYSYSLDLHRAHLCMLTERRIVPARSAAIIKQGIDHLARAWTPPEYLPTQERIEDLYFLFEEKLAGMVGQENAAWLHTARSRNDMDGTIFRLALKDRLLAFLASCIESARAMAQRCAEGQTELTLLYTHGQPANPSTTGHYLSAFLLDFLEDCEALAMALEAVDRSTLGACAITGTGFPLDRQRTAALLGFEGTVENSYRAISSSRWLVAPAQAMRALMIDIGRFVADLGHKASVEVGLYNFPDSLVQVSSIMPQKRNPVIIEHIRIKAERVAGICSMIETGFANVPYQDVNENADEPVSAFLDCFDLATAAVDLVASAACAMQGNKARARELCLHFGVTTTELADTMVRRLGIGFRTAHALCSDFVRSGMDREALRKSFGDRTGIPLEWDDAEIDRILDPDTFVAVRNTEGGPSAMGMEPVYHSLRVKLEDISELLDRKERSRELAGVTLNAAWDALGRSPV